MLEAGESIELKGGRYRLLAPLAGSAYGLVWRAEAPHGGAQVALKLVNREQMARAAESERVHWFASARKEIDFLQSLAPWDGRHIVRLLDSGEHDGLPAMALELMDRDLATHLAAERGAGRAIAFAQVLAWIGQLNQALAKVHQYGWRHLDLKPSNVLYDAGSGNVKLADFGTNRHVAAREHSYAGTAGWQAPEQFFPAAEQAYDTDARSDYFALGVMFYHLVTGNALRFCSDCGQAYREHRGDGPARLLARHLGSAPATLHADEEALFAHCVGQAPPRPGGDDLTWCPAQGPAQAGAPALALLRTLLAGQRERRPRHAIDISRMLAAIHGTAGATGCFA